MRFDWKRCLIYNRSFNRRWNYIFCCSFRVLHVLFFFTPHFRLTGVSFSFAIPNNIENWCEWYMCESACDTLQNHLVTFFSSLFDCWFFLLLLLFDLLNTLRLNSLGACALCTLKHTETEKETEPHILLSASVIQSMATLIDSICCCCCCCYCLWFVHVAFSFSFSSPTLFRINILFFILFLYLSPFDVADWLFRWRRSMS